MEKRGDKKGGPNATKPHGFLSGEISSRMRDSAQAESSENLGADWEATKRALQRVAAPRKLRELQTEFDQLKKMIRGRVAGGKKEAKLKAFIRTVKAEDPNYTHRRIAENVDRRLGQAKTNFALVAPQNWRSKYQLPVRFADVFSRPSNDPLRRLAKSYISKA